MKQPYLLAAFICERVLIEKDDVPSAIRIIDTFNIVIQKGLPSPPNSLPTIQITLLAIFKSEERSTHTLTFEIAAPSGKRTRSGAETIVSVDGQERGANVALRFPVVIDQEGVYWIDLLLDKEKVTRIPFRVNLPDALARNHLT
jgi:hypothetical protein